MRTAAVLFVLSACQPGLPTHTLRVGDLPVKVEVAATNADRAVGLMNRDHMPADEGMIFVYPSAANRSFWMKNTRIPLDIAFLDHQGAIVRIVQMSAFSTDRTPSLQPAQYALEMNLDWFSTHGVTRGTVVTDLPVVDAEP